MSKFILVLFSILLVQACSAGSGSSNSNTTFSPLQNFTDADPSLVTVISTYTDVITKKETIIRGTGFLVKSADRLFVITASHVSQGQNLKILQTQGEIQVISRYYPRKSDIEIIEVNAKNISTHFEHSSDGIVWNTDKKFSFRQIDSQSFVLKNAWVKDDNLQADNDYVTRNPKTMNLDNYGYTLSSESLIQPGYSGAPLISKIAEPFFDTSGMLSFDLREGFNLKALSGKYFVRGLAIKRDRFFANSTFISSRIIQSTIKDFLNKTPIKDTDINTWMLNSGVLIRKVDYDTFEAAALGSVVGNGVSADGGNGVSADGGNGVSVDGSDLLGLASDSPIEILKKITPFPVGPNQREQMFWIMMTRSHAGELYSANAWFDAETYQYINRFIMGTKPEKEDFVQLFYQRVFNLDTKKPIVSLDQNSKIIFGADDVQVQVGGKTPFQFSIRRDGKICHSAPAQCTTKFSPLVEILANDQQTWLIVDLKLLMFYDVATPLKNQFRDPAITKLTDQEYYKLADKAMLDEMVTLTLRFRPKKEIGRILTIEELQAEYVIWRNWK